MAEMRLWSVRREDGCEVDSFYYAVDCDEDYIRRAEDVPDHYTLRRES